jgi:hypothetical protein
MKALSKRRQTLGEDDSLLADDDRKYVELRFMLIVLDFFNYHVSLARRDHASRAKARWLVHHLLPDFDEMRTALQDYYVHEDVTSLTLIGVYRTS